MITEEKLIEEALTRYPVTKIWKTEEWTVFGWNDCLYYVQNDDNVPDWEVGDQIAPIDVLWNQTKRKTTGYKFEINESNPVFEEGFKQGYEKGRADVVRDLTNKYIFGGRK